MYAENVRIALCPVLYSRRALLPAIMLRMGEIVSLKNTVEVHWLYSIISCVNIHLISIRYKLASCFWQQAGGFFFLAVVEQQATGTGRVSQKLLSAKYHSLISSGSSSVGGFYPNVLDRLWVWYKETSVKHAYLTLPWHLPFELDFIICVSFSCMSWLFHWNFAECLMSHPNKPFNGFN